MSMLSGDELSDIRAEVESIFLPGTATILTPTSTVDIYGGVNETWGTADTVACRIDPFNRQDSSGVVADQEKGRTWYQLTVPSSATIADGDRVVIDSATYDVVQLHDLHNNRFVTRAILSLLRVTTTVNQLLYAENIGGAALENSQGGTWSADGTYGNAAGTQVSGLIDIDTSHSSVDQSRTYELRYIAQSHRWGVTSYTFPTTAGQIVDIVIYTYESFWTEAAQRVFDVAVDGVVASEFNDIDVISVTGAQYKVLKLSTRHTCTGPVTVATQIVTDNPIVCGIEIFEVS